MNSILRMNMAAFTIAVVSSAQGLVLYNTLDGDGAVLNSAVGPPLSFYAGGAPYPMVVGTRVYEPGKVGNAITYGPGPYAPGVRANLLTLTNPGSILSAERGTIEAWCFSREELYPYHNNVYVVLGGVYCGQEGGFALWAQNIDYQGARLYFYIDLCGARVDALSVHDGREGFPIAGLTNQWLHFAACWDRAGIAGTGHTVRLYLNGDLVASNTQSNWGTTFGQITYATSAADDAIVGKFLFDELKVWNRAKTSFVEPQLSFFQPDGAGTALMGMESKLVVGHEYFTLFSLDLSPNGVGSGPWGGLWFSDLNALVSQLLVPVGTVPFHFVAAEPRSVFGRYLLPAGITFESICVDVLGPISPAVRYTVN